jgi:hypothetical protein
MQWPIDKGQAMQWPNDKGQTMQWPNDKGQAMQWPNDKGRAMQWPKFTSYYTFAIFKRFPLEYFVIDTFGFISVGNRSTWRTPPSCGMSLTNFIT